MPLSHGSGSGYWSSENWDPDSRVYTGADIFQTHRLAVQPDHPEPKTEPEKLNDKQELEQPLRRKGSAAYWGAMDEGLDDLDLGIGDISLARSPPTKKVSFDGGYSDNQNQTNPGQGLDVDRSALLRKGSSDYWTSGNWNLDQRGMMKLDKRPDPAMVEEMDTPSTQSGSASVKCLPRKDSNAYWDADQWDPDERIYVGAEAGQTNHLTAVIQSDDKLIRTWPGGLTCGGTCGQSGPVDILKALKALGEVSEVPEHPELRDIYEVEAESVGFGSFGIVRKATHLPTGTHCVVKSLKKSQCGPLYKSQGEHGLFEQLLSMSVRTPHDGIVKYLDMLESEDHYYVVMEDLRGPELLEQMERLFPITEAHCQQIMREILVALVHIHGKVGICHRDIKLDNFKYRTSEPGSPLVLLDFGFLAPLDKPWDSKKCGTRMYMAPEVIADAVEQPLLPAIDIWAAGVLLYTLFTGDCPVQPEQLQTLAPKSEKAETIVAEALRAGPLNSMSTEARDLLQQLLRLEAGSRITAADALKHPWFSLALDAAPVVPARRGSYRKTATKSINQDTQALESPDQ